jgi:uncharacterized membrane protein YkoI
MSGPQRAAAAVAIAAAITLSPVWAGEVHRQTHGGAEWPRVCLNAKERRALVESGVVLRLAVALRGIRRSIPGTLLRARLCRRREGYVYVLTILAHDGKVVHLAIDAATGTLVGRR